jgi:hypothetical protein
VTKKRDGRKPVAAKKKFDGWSRGNGLAASGEWLLEKLQQNPGSA